MEQRIKFYCAECGCEYFYDSILCDIKSKRYLCYKCFHGHYPSKPNYYYDLLSDNIAVDAAVSNEAQLLPGIRKYLLNWRVRGYVRRQCDYDEKILYLTKRHWLSLFWPSVLVFILYKLLYRIEMQQFVGFVYVSIVFGSVAWLIKSINLFITLELGVTNKRILCNDIHKLPGIYFYDDMTPLEGISLTKVLGISVKQTSIGRFFNYGSIIVQGKDGIGGAIHFINNPIMFQQKAHEVIFGVLEPRPKGGKSKRAK